MSKRYTTEEFIEKARRVHGDAYDYSHVVYVDSVTPVEIICPFHGPFRQRPAMHLMGTGCNECGKMKTKAALSDDKDKFVTKARDIHGEKYDYSLVDYQGSDVKVEIICPIHGLFLQTPHMHLQGQECPVCGRIKSDENRKKGLAVFLEQARAVHGDKYDYSRVDLIRRDWKVCIVCPEHGEFWQSPGNHVLQRQGCPLCARKTVANKITKDTEWFLDKVHKIHGDRYDYSETEYVSARDKVCVICHEKDDGGFEHGRFWLTPHAHLTHSGGCPKCGHPSHTLKWWLEEARKVHGDRYDYSQVKYVNNKTLMKIICPDHGEFLQRPMLHLSGSICPKCNGFGYSREEILEQFKQVHGDRYDYSKVEYVSKNTQVCIICKEHGEFWQRPSGHLRGQGCPICNQSHMENEMMQFLDRKGAHFIRQKTFDWLVYKSHMYLDFFLPDYGVAIECQGGQHFVADPFMGGDEGLELIQARDRKKEALCQEHGINVLYYSDYGIEYPYPVFEDISALWVAVENEGDFDPDLWRDPVLPFEFD